MLSKISKSDRNRSTPAADSAQTGSLDYSTGVQHSARAVTSDTKHATVWTKKKILRIAEKKNQYLKSLFHTQCNLNSVYYLKPPLFASLEVTLLNAL